MLKRKAGRDEYPSLRRCRPAPVSSSAPDSAQPDTLPAVTQYLLDTARASMIANANISNPDPGVEANYQKALELLQEKKRNIFITGPAGSGKTYMIAKLATQLELDGRNVSIVAPTGLAAVNIGGQTIHSFFGLTPDLAQKELFTVAALGRTVSGTQQRLKAVDVLIIDEISMVANEFLERINAMAQEARDKRRPFGGIQIIAVGDFAQLPPVKGQEFCIDCGRTRQETLKKLSCVVHGIVEDEDKWAFRSKIWRLLRFETIVLDKILRQNDAQFAQIIMTIWLGNRLTAQQRRALSVTTIIEEPALRLFPCRKEVDNYNIEASRALGSEPEEFHCRDAYIAHDRHQQLQWGKAMGTTSSEGILHAMHDHRLPAKLQLQEKMPVILLHNLDISRGLVNGAIGSIVRFETYDPALHHISGVSVRTIGYTWSGEGLANADIIPSLGGGSAFWTRSGISEFHAYHEAGVYPVVKFHNGIEMTITPHCDIEQINDGEAVTVRMRTQVPLLPAWALTIHRCQGMSLDRVFTDLEKSFEPGQQYVALSRARSLAGLQVRGLKKSAAIRPAPVVRAFMRTWMPDELRQRMQ